jgi:hypothetical protein
MPVFIGQVTELVRSESLGFWMSEQWTESRNPVILSVIHHCQDCL